MIRAHGAGESEAIHSLARALPNDASLILVGDVDQLPSVPAGTGNPLPH